jgi:hypothetical protein
VERAIRFAVIGVCVAGIAGMIVASATNHNGAAITFGLITAVAVLCQMVATTVANELKGAAKADVSGAGDALENQVMALVSAGADETAVRDLVRAAARLGRSHGGSTTR